MASWQIYTKEARVVSTNPMLTIGKKLGRCGLNRAAALMLEREGIEHVLLMWDPETLRIGLRSSTRKDPRSFAVRYGYKKDKDKIVIGAAFSGVTFLRHIGYELLASRSFPITWNADESVFEVKLSEECFPANQQPLRAVEGGKKHAKAGH
jgi:hypothetical protein